MCGLVWSTMQGGAGSRDGAVVRVLAFHQCGPGSTPGPGVICGLGLLLVLVLAPRVFLRALRFPPSVKNISKFQFNLDVRSLHMSPWLGRLGDYSLTTTLNLIYLTLIYPFTMLPPRAHDPQCYPLGLVWPGSQW